MNKIKKLTAKFREIIMLEELKTIDLKNALGASVRVSLKPKIASTDNGMAIYFDSLRFNDDFEVIYFVNSGGTCGSCQVLPQEYEKFKAVAKAQNLIN